MATGFFINYDTKRLSETRTIPGHDFVVLESFYFDGTLDEWVRAQSDDELTLATHVCVRVDGDEVEFAERGRFELSAAHGKALDTQFYLSDSVAGGSTSTPPTIQQGLFIPYSTTGVHINVWSKAIKGADSIEVSEFTALYNRITTLEYLLEEKIAFKTELVRATTQTTTINITQKCRLMIIYNQGVDRAASFASPIGAVVDALIRNVAEDAAATYVFSDAANAGDHAGGNISYTYVTDNLEPGVYADTGVTVSLTNAPSYSGTHRLTLVTLPPGED